MVADVLDDVGAERLVERRDDERLSAARLADVLPLGTVRRPDADLPLARVLVREEGLAEANEAARDAGAVAVDVLVRVPLELLGPVTRRSVPGPCTEAVGLGAHLEAEVEALVGGGGEGEAGAPLWVLDVDVDGRAARLLAAGQGLRAREKRKRVRESVSAEVERGEREVGGNEWAHDGLRLLRVVVVAQRDRVRALCGHAGLCFSRVRDGRGKGWRATRSPSALHSPSGRCGGSLAGFQFRTSSSKVGAERSLPGPRLSLST